MFPLHQRRATVDRTSVVRESRCDTRTQAGASSTLKSLGSATYCAWVGSWLAQGVGGRSGTSSATGLTLRATREAATQTVDTAESDSRTCLRRPQLSPVPGDSAPA